MQWLTKAKDFYVALRDFALFPDPRTLEYVLCGHCLVWGFWLMLPWPNFYSNPLYLMLMTVLSRDAWILLFGGLGVLRLVALAHNILWMRQLVNLVSIALWGFVTSIIAVLNPGTMATAATGYTTFLALIAYGRSRHE